MSDKQLEKTDTSVKSNWGGRRKGSGRKPSNFTIMTMKQRRDVFNRMLQESGLFVDLCEKIFQESLTDPRLAVWTLEQSFGKAPKIDEKKDLGRTINIVITAEQIDAMAGYIELEEKN